MKKRFAALSMAALIGLGTFSGPAFAETADLENQKADVQQKRSEVRANLSSAEKQIADVLFELQDLNKKISKTDAALKANESKLQETKDSIAASENEVSKLNEEIDELEKQIVKRFELLKKRLVVYQQSGGDIAFLDVLAGSKDFSEFISRAKAVSEISQSDINLVKQLEDDQNKVEAKKAAVNEKLKEQKEEKEDLEGVAQTIQDQKKQQELNKEALVSKEKELADKKASLKMKDSELASLETTINEDIESENRREAEQRAARAAAAKAQAEAAQQAEQAQKQQPAASQPSADSSQSSSNSDKPSNDSSTPSKAPKPTDSTPSQAGGLGAAIQAGYSVIGTPYVWGGKQPGGFDCSGFVSWAYRQAGISVPSSTSGLQYVGTKISYSSAKPGDMVFFNTYKTNGHVGIYLGGGKFIGAQDSGLDIADMSSGYWKAHFTGHVRRVQ